MRKRSFRHSRWRYVPTLVSLGAGIGLGVGLIFQDVAFGIAVGAALGAGLGLLFAVRNPR